MLFGQCFDKLGRAFFKLVKVSNYVSLSLSKAATNRVYSGSGTGLRQAQPDTPCCFQKEVIILTKIGYKPYSPFQEPHEQKHIKQDLKLESKF
jgi:hypothetical protein